MKVWKLIETIIVHYYIDVCEYSLYTSRLNIIINKSERKKAGKNQIYLHKEWELVKKLTTYPHYSIKRKYIEQQLKEQHITKTTGLDSIAIYPM